MAPRYFSRPNLLNFLLTGSNTASYESVPDLDRYEEIIKTVKDWEGYERLNEPFHDLVVRDGIMERSRSNWDRIEIAPEATRSWFEGGQDRQFIATAVGGAGNDWIRGNDHDNILIGDDFNEDTMFHNGGTGREDGEYGAYRDQGNDTLYGLAGRDRLFGNAGNDYLDGGRDDDELWGGANNDVLVGGAGYDKMYGGTGDDILIGGLDGGYYEGGAGKDQFIVDQTPGFGVHWIADLKDEGDQVLIQPEQHRNWIFEIDDRFPDSPQLLISDANGFGTFATINLHEGMHYHISREGIQVMGENGQDEATLSF